MKPNISKILARHLIFSIGQTSQKLATIDLVFPAIKLKLTILLRFILHLNRQYSNPKLVAIARYSLGKAFSTVNLRKSNRIAIVALSD